LACDDEAVVAPEDENSQGGASVTEGDTADDGELLAVDAAVQLQARADGPHDGESDATMLVHAVLRDGVPVRLTDDVPE
jgi:hypothetical protein